MTLQDLAALATLLSSIAVAVSLIYLAYQIRQSAKHQRGVIGHGRTEHVQQLVQFASDPAFMDTVVRGRAGDPGLEPVRCHQFYWFAYAVFATFEDTFHQHRGGMIERAVHDTAVAQMRSQVSAPGMRAAWRMMRPTFEPGFAAFIDALIRDTPPEGGHDLAAAWKALAAKELATTPAPGPRPMDHPSIPA